MENWRGSWIWWSRYFCWRVSCYYCSCKQLRYFPCPAWLSILNTDRRYTLLLFHSIFYFEEWHTVQGSFHSVKETFCRLTKYLPLCLPTFCRWYKRMKCILSFLWHCNSGMQERAKIIRLSENQNVLYFFVDKFRISEPDVTMSFIAISVYCYETSPCTINTFVVDRYLMGASSITKHAITIMRL